MGLADRPGRSMAWRRPCAAPRRVSSIGSPLFPAVDSEIEGKDAVRTLRALQHLRMAQSANRVVVARPPMFFHRPAREFVVLGGSLVVLGAIDQLDQIVDFLV